VEEFQAMLGSLEYLLLRYIFPTQLEIYRIIDDTLQKGPSTADAADLKMLITRNVESYRYFFKHADERWLAFLRENQFLEPRWETGEYLSRVASAAPKEVLNIFNEMPLLDENWQAKTSFAEAASKLPAKYAVGAVQRVVKEGWVKETRATLLHYRLLDLLKTLLSGREFVAAVHLSDALLDIFAHGYGSYGSADTRAYISEYEYAQTVDEIEKIPAEEIYPFLKIIRGKLVKALKEVHARGEEGGDDYSYIWHPAVDGVATKHAYDRMDDCLISGVRDLLHKHAEYLLSQDRVSDLARDVEEILSHSPQYPLLTRMRLHFLRQFPNAFRDEVTKELLLPRTQGGTWHEYSMLVNQEFPRLSKADRKKYFEAVDALDKEEDEFADSWRVRLLVIVREHLTLAEKKKYSELLKNGEHLEERFFTSYMKEATIVGPNSPKTEEDLIDKTPEEVIEVLKSWQPTDEFMGPSRSGLGMIFRDVVAKRVGEYGPAAMLFVDEELRPVFVYNYFSGLIEALKQKVELDWDAILSLVSAVIAKAKEGVLYELDVSKEGRMEADWEDVTQEIARVLMRGFDTNSLTLKHRNEAWQAIAFLAEHPNPTPEHEQKYGQDNSDPFTMSINTVRGDAFHAVFAYVFWYNRAEKVKNDKWVNMIPDEAKTVLERHLDPAHDPSLTIRSVYGRYFPWFLSYGKEWSEALIPKVFPRDNVELRYAAWETYLSLVIFQDAYRLMRPYYDLAVEDLREGRVPKRRYWADAIERLAEHTMIAYAYEIEDGPTPFYEIFFSKASGKCRGIAVSMAGRHYISRDNFPHGEEQPEISVLKRFWDWRLEASDAPSELREFGWWAKLGKFDNKWMLERLLKTVEKTKGDIDGEYLVMGTLDALSEEYPLLCVKIIKHIFASTSRRDRYVFLHMGELRSVLTKVLKNGDDEAKKIVHETIDYLLKLGFEDLRTLGDAL
jgi:hypothetical protein